MRSKILLLSIVIILLGLRMNGIAALSDLLIYENRDIYAGENHNQIRCYEDAVVNMYGGVGMQGVYAFNNSELFVYGGAAGTYLTSDDASNVHVYAGDFTGLRVQLDGTMNLRGGNVYSTINVYDSGELNIYNISLDTGFHYLIAYHDSIVNIYGSDFSFNPSGGVRNVGQLSGRWIDGSQFILDFFDGNVFPDHVVLHEAPEPDPNYVVTILTDPSYVDTVISETRYDFDNQQYYADINAGRFINCPEVYRFDHWEGQDITEPDSSETTVILNGDTTITAVFIDDQKCGDECHPNFITGDLNHDCYIDIHDFAMMAIRWMTCTHPACDEL